jgi:hypothetical protein
MITPAHQSPSADAPPAEVCLLLRAHAEARWLSREVVPLIRDLEQHLRSDAALSYLESLSIEARHHADETEAALADLDALGINRDQVLDYNARRYHAAVRRLRATIERRTQRLLTSTAG